MRLLGAERERPLDEIAKLAHVASPGTCAKA
ncbi:MAG: hypothetical protein QOI41_5602, partial [Myxococcales bacterium]|nr:hypothetical protein [Myxococcales bacterium]